MDKMVCIQVYWPDRSRATALCSCVRHKLSQLLLICIPFSVQEYKYDFANLLWQPESPSCFMLLRLE